MRELEALEARAADARKTHAQRDADACAKEAEAREARALAEDAQREVERTRALVAAAASGAAYASASVSAVASAAATACASNTPASASAPASALSHRMLASYAVNHGLQVVSYDVSQAFLQGLLLKDLEKRGEMKRTVFFDLPEDAWALLWEEMPEKIALLNKTYSSQEVTLQAIKRSLWSRRCSTPMAGTSPKPYTPLIAWSVTSCEEYVFPSRANFSSISSHSSAHASCLTSFCAHFQQILPWLAEI